VFTALYGLALNCNRSSSFLKGYVKCKVGISSEHRVIPRSVTKFKTVRPCHQLRSTSTKERVKWRYSSKHPLPRN
jgi:hypothetical protein